MLRFFNLYEFKTAITILKSFPPSPGIINETFWAKIPLLIRLSRLLCGSGGDRIVAVKLSRENYIAIFSSR